MCLHICSKSSYEQIFETLFTIEKNSVKIFHSFWNMKKKSSFSLEQVSHYFLTKFSKK